ncbi:helix-turn-helix domain-containing protein [Gynuella sp.]|uniref:helix-turn-helix domain-containing protein n=1 Tax=Gynuella sp. TaxID=2969146 RepID=UPI003D0F6A52
MSTHQSAERILTVLDLLLQRTVHGLTPSEIAKATGYSAPNVSRYVAVLESTGWAERIPETNRIRASVRVAQRAMGVLQEFDRAQQRLGELRTRITTPIN